MAGEAASHLSKGGMRTKLIAARTAMGAGCAMAIAQGDQSHALRKLADGGRCTWFRSKTTPQAAYKAWISAMKSVGEITIDDGAVKALRSGNSLLPAGVIRVTGTFERGDSVTIVDSKGAHLGYGLTRYNADEARTIAGARSEKIADLLGYTSRAALIHRDDMVV